MRGDYSSWTEIYQEPDSTEAFKHLPTRSASPEHPLKEDGEESKTGKDGLCCLHCKEIIDGYAHRGFYTNCAYRVQKRCPNCRQMVGDIDRHMKRHPETASLRCTVQGCDSTRVFTKEGLLRHRQRAHPAIFSREGIIRRRQQRGLAEYFAKHDSLSLSEADSPVMECEMDQMTRMMCNLRCSDECEV